MNVFNRIIMIILCLVAIAFSIIVFLLVVGVVRPAQVSPGGLLSGLWRLFSQRIQSKATIAAIVCALLVIVALILLVVDINILRGDTEQFLVRDDSLGKVTVARSGV